MELKERVRQAIFKEHNELLDTNDPLLMSITLNDHVLAHYSERFEEQLERLEDKQSDKAAAVLNDASRMSTELIEKAGQYAVTMLNETANQIKNDYQQANEQHLKALKAESQGRSGASNVNLWNIYLVSGSVGLILGFLLRSLMH